MKNPSGLVVLLAGWLSPLAGAGPLEEIERLEAGMEAAHERYLADHGDEARDDPRLPILKAMDAMARSAKGERESCRAATLAFEWSAGLDLDPAELLNRFSRVLPCAGVEDLSDAIRLTPDVFSRAGEPAGWIGVLEQLNNAQPGKELRADILLSQGRILLKAGKPEEAKSKFAQAVALGSAADAVKTAKGYVFEIEHLQVGMPAPDFETSSLESAGVSLKSFRGKVVLLNFWATWCTPCLAEIQHWKELATAFKDRPFVIISVSLDDLKEILAATVEQRGVPGIQTWDPTGRENPVGSLYNVQELPQWFLIDTKGVIRARNPSAKELERTIEGLMPK